MLYAVYCILYTANMARWKQTGVWQCELYTVYCIPYAVYCIRCAVNCIPYTVYCILYVVYCMSYTLCCMPYTVYFILLPRLTVNKQLFASVSCIHTCILYTICCILYTVCCKLYTVYCILYTVCCILYVIYPMLYAVYSILYTATTAHSKQTAVCQCELYTHMSQRPELCYVWIAGIDQTNILWQPQCLHSPRQQAWPSALTLAT